MGITPTHRMLSTALAVLLVALASLPEVSATSWFGGYQIDPDRLKACSHGNVPSTQCCCYCRDASRCKGHGMVFTTYCDQACNEDHEVCYCPCGVSDRYGQPYSNVTYARQS